MINNTFILRIAVVITLIAHSIPGILDGSINDFGNLYLNQHGFAPFGLYIAWAIKLSHVLCAVLFIFNKYLNFAVYCTIFVLVAGIVMVHFQEGWYVVGGGRNGMEFNFLLICVLFSILYQNRIGKATVGNN